MKERIRMSGILRGVIRGPEGNIKDSFILDNLVVTTGRQHIANQLADLSQGPMSHMAIGVGDGSGGYNPQVIGDTALQSELNRKIFTSKAQGAGGDANKVVYVCDWPPGEGTGTIVEAGVFNAPSAGIMLCRTTFEQKNKGQGDSLTLTWTITISG